MSNALEAKVAAVNRANAAANELYPQMVAIFSPLVGRRLDKASGGFYDKIKKLLPVLPNTQQLQIFRSSSNYALGFTVKTCELNPPHGCFYHEVGVNIGSMTHGVLTDMQTYSPRRSDYTVEEVLDLRAQYIVKKNAAQQAYSAINEFGEYDR